jgi:DNA-binding transcriptional MerR regulator/methylmalonyl-CoA mutase cobalamin-binding subunit
VEEGISIGALSRATGVSIHCLRIWERRYGAPKSLRRASGHRRYPTTEIRRLRAVNLALAAGFRAGEVAGADAEKLDELLRSVERTGQTNGKPRGDSAFEAYMAIDQWVEATNAYDERRLASEFQDSWVRLGPLRFASERVAPYLKRLGDGWRCGQLGVSEEHFGAERLCDFLSSQWRPQNEACRLGPLLLASLPGEGHRLGLHLCASVAVAARFRVVFLGPLSPPEEIARAAEVTGAKAVCLSISRSVGARNVLRNIERLRDILPSAIPIICGGEGAPEKSAGVEVYDDFTPFYEFLRGQFAADEVA